VARPVQGWAQGAGRVQLRGAALTGPDLVMVARWAFYVSALGMFGAAFFPFYAGCHAAVPSRGTLVGTAVLSWIGCLIWFGTLVAEFVVPSEPIWRTAATLITSTSFGPAWAIRIAATTAAVATAARAATGTTAVLALSGIVLATDGWIGHAAMGGPSHRIIHLVHVFAAAAWLGGLIPLARVIRTSETDPAPALDTLRRFSRVGVACVLLIVGSGIANVGFVVGGVPEPDLPYTRWLATKVMLFLTMVALALVNRLWLTPRLAAPGPARALEALRRTVLLESLVGAFVLGTVSVLGVMSPS
jgi:putative copper resistance protein D